MNCDNVTYFGAEHISVEIKKFIHKKNNKTNIYRMQANVCIIMCAYFWIGFIDFMLKVKVCSVIPLFFLLANMKRAMK